MDATVSGCIVDRNQPDAVVDSCGHAVTHLQTGTDASTGRESRTVFAVEWIVNVSIAAPTFTKVYDGSTSIAATATQLQDWTTQLGVIGDTVDGITLTYNDKNVGTGKTLTPSVITINDGNGGANYNITFANDTTSVITRLGSVTWIGGTSGDWNDPANWAGGAVPDLANVANVIIPFGVTPTFGTNVAGPVQIDSFTGGNLQLDSGTLDVDGAFTADALTQNGGVLSTGTLQATDFTQTAGTVTVDNTFTVTNSFTQSPTASIDVVGQVDITHTTGVLTINNVSRDAVKLNSTTGGDLTQSPTSQIDIGTISTFNTTSDIRLGGQQNRFRGPVSLEANSAEIKQSTGNLVLDVVDVVEDFAARSLQGNLFQTATGAITVGNQSNFAARREIQLSSSSNDFAGTVQVDSPVFRLQSLTPIVIRKTGVALADEAIAMQAQTVNDTLVRPASPNATSGSSPDSPSSQQWIVKFASFVTGLFQRQTVDTPASTLVPADVFVGSDDIFIKRQDTHSSQ